MSGLGRLLGASLLIQVAGAIATLLGTIWVTRVYGPVGQGYVGYFRSAVDLVVGIGTFGLPQAFVYMLNKQVASVGWALRFSTAYSALFALLIAVLGAAFYVTGTAQAKGLDAAAVVCGVLTSIALLAHGLYRAICLVTRSTVTFNLVTILPPVLLLALYLLAHSDNYQTLVLVHAAAGAMSLCIVIALFPFELFRQAGTEATQQTFRFAAQYGFWSFLPHVSLAAATFLTYALLLNAPGTQAAVGYFSVSVMFVSAAVMPLTMVIPVLFNAWSQPGIEDRRRASFMKLSHVGSLTCLAAVVIGMPLVEPATQLVFGSQLLPSAEATKVLLLSAFALYQTRLASALLLALGRADAVAVGSVVRLATILALILLLDGSVTSAAVAWAIAEFAGAGYLLFTVLKVTRWPVLETVGVSPAWLMRALQHLRGRKS